MKKTFAKRSLLFLSSFFILNLSVVTAGEIQSVSCLSNNTVIESGNTYTIKWSTNDKSDTVQIVYWDVYASKWSMIAESVPAYKGNIVWSVPQLQYSTSIVIHIRSIKSSNNYTYVRNYLNIKASPRQTSQTSESSVQEIPMIEGVSVYPNPAHETITLLSGNKLPKQITVYDTYGTAYILDVQTGNTISVVSLPSGVYTGFMSIENVIQKISFVVQK